MTELEIHQPHNSLIDQMNYAKTVSVASMLPDSYRGKPADIMLAVGLGQSMGLSPAESLYRIAVIKGKPTASAELIAANVRKAGHRLRVSGTDTSATATIIRADDPDYEFTVTRDIEWAKSMKLDGNDNYRKQPGTMLQWRAITAVARLACPEALYGVAYSPDEMADIGEQRQASGGLGAALNDEPATVTAEQIHDEPQTDSPLLDTRGSLAKRMFATFRTAGLEAKEDRLAYASAIVGREVESSSELTDAEAEEIIRALESITENAGAQA